jgi:predicted glutamine amidotransferase
MVAVDQASDVVGVGAYDDGVVTQRFGVGAAREALWEVPSTDAVLMHAGQLAVGHDFEASTQPFRFRQWLFAHAGAVDRPEALRERLVSELPEFIQRVLKGRSLGEAIFGVFLSQLHELGRIEDPGLEGPLAAQLLARTAKIVTVAAEEARHRSRPALNLVATNGRVLVAAHKGNEPLVYRLLEGEPTCEVCGLEKGLKDTEPKVREHRRRRSVVLATAALSAAGWVAIDRKLTLQTVA